MLIVDGEPLEARAGDTLLEALLRAGRHPTNGGCLCTAGDCGHCLATVDGVAYSRTCRIRVEESCRVEEDRQSAGVRRVETDHRRGSQPPLPPPGPAPEPRPGPEVHHLVCDVIVVGRGEAGRLAVAEARRRGDETLVYDEERGEEVIGIYPGPLVVVKTPSALLEIRPRRTAVIATGAMEIQPVAPGNELEGLFTRRAVERLASRDIDLGHVVAVGRAPAGVECDSAHGQLLRFEGTVRVEAVVTVDDEGHETRWACDSVSLDLGVYPRDVLARMAAGVPDLEVEIVGDAALVVEPPSCPETGVVCPCAGVDAGQLADVWKRGFREMELLKRSTLAGTGACQGAACMPYLRGFLRQREGEVKAPFTARPLARQRTIGELASGSFHPSTPRTALDGEHRTLGARMERSGGWWRPWSYGDREAEYRAVREAVSICDVSTLGKMHVRGPDALELLERLYPTSVATIARGRSRYALLLDERGYVLDDGMICREPGADHERFYLTFASGSSTLVELRMRDCAESWGLDARLLDVTLSDGAINVTGPRAAQLLALAGTGELPPFGGHVRTTVAGVPCRVLRLSFTGELSYELHHPSAASVGLWRRLLELGESLGCRPHGLEALLALRLEKGHILVGQDTDFDSTPRRIGHDQAVDRSKPDFVGKTSLERTDRIPLDRRLVGLEMPLPAPLEGAVVWHDGEYAGYVTSSAESPALDRAVLLAWCRTVDDEGRLPEEVTVDGRRAKRATVPFYDPHGARARVAVENAALPAAREGVAEAGDASGIGDRQLRRVDVERIVARPDALDTAPAPKAVDRGTRADPLVLRTAADEALILFTTAPSGNDRTASASAVLDRDPHAIVVDDTGWWAAAYPRKEAEALLTRMCDWSVPDSRSAGAQGSVCACAQGNVAGIPAKLWLDDDRVIFLVQAPHAHDLETRLRATLETLS